MTAVEPSAALRARSPPHLAPALDAAAEQLPRPAGSFDAAMTTVTTAATTAVSAYTWSDPAARSRC
ncbi:hypothetical protein ACFVFQ_23235 [Streptomyces sp. NPDC057743]|uniref:hypothetical protein n=1 Tax=Streptomyces sp. NPDC057743 TaxID=3346236 RepID=UPI0036C842DF